MHGRHVKALQAAIENMISQFGSVMFACVMDSHDNAAVRAAADHIAALFP